MQESIDRGAHLYIHTFLRKNFLEGRVVPSQNGITGFSKRSHGLHCVDDMRVSNSGQPQK